MSSFMRRCLPVLALVGFVALSGSVRADSVLIGAPATGANSFPFGGINAAVGDRYQQVYNSALFSGPISINDITFFHTNFPIGDMLDTADYVISLSTTSAAVNGLDTVNFDANLGADNTLFLSTHLSGIIGSTLDLMGNTYNYDPSQGNLLLDIKKSNSLGDGTVFLDARNGDFGTDSSRAHDFGTGFEGFGLVTEFSGPGNNVVPEAGTLLSFGGLLFGLGGLALRRRNRK